jgi:hypothetical protein
MLIDDTINGVVKQMTDYDHAEALLSLREAHDDEPVPRDDLDADAQIIDDLARRGEVVETDDGLVPTEAYESTEEIPLPDGGQVRNTAEDHVRGILSILKRDRAEVFRVYEHDELESAGVKIEFDGLETMDGDAFADFQPDEVNVMRRGGDDTVTVVLRWNYDTEAEEAPADD